jgi:hypothetical protein
MKAKGMTWFECLRAGQRIALKTEDKEYEITEAKWEMARATNGAPIGKWFSIHALGISDRIMPGMVAYVRDEDGSYRYCRDVANYMNYIPEGTDEDHLPASEHGFLMALRESWKKAAAAKGTESKEETKDEKPQ